MSEIEKDLSKLAETNGKGLQFVNKRVDITQQNVRRLKILSPLYEHDAGSNKDNDIYSYVINKAIEYFYKSDEVKERLENV